MQKLTPEVEQILLKRFGNDSLIALATTVYDKPSVRVVDAFYENANFYVRINELHLPHIALPRPCAIQVVFVLIFNIILHFLQFGNSIHSRFSSYSCKLGFAVYSLFLFVENKTIFTSYFLIS